MMMETGQANETPPGMDRPRTGAYYWLPLPGDPAVRWDVITCHDLGRDADVGHLRLWPEVVRRLARAWGKDPDRMVRRLGEHYAGLPRGRVTRVRGAYLVQHGDDTPTIGGLGAIEGRFGLVGRRVKFLVDEHEHMLSGDPEPVQRALGVDLGLRGV
jgi:hypothetical protein